MLMLIAIIIVLTLVGIAVAWRLSRRLRSLKSGRLIVGVGVLVLIGGSLLLSLDQERLRDQLQTRSWPTVTGAIVEGKLIRKGEIYGPLIVYKYNVAGVEFIDSSHAHAPGFGGKRKRLDVAEHVLAEYVPGSPVTVYYDQAHPERSTLIPGPVWNVYGQLGFGGMLYVAGIALLSLTLFSHLRRRKIDGAKKAAPASGL